MINITGNYNNFGFRQIASSVVLNHCVDDYLNQKLQDLILSLLGWFAIVLILFQAH